MLRLAKNEYLVGVNAAATATALRLDYIEFPKCSPPRCVPSYLDFIKNATCAGHATTIAVYMNQ